MSWQDKTPQDRADLRERRTRRRKAKSRRTAGFWAAKLSQARTPIDRASVAWDRLRCELHAMPSMSREEWDRAWSDVERRLDAIRADVTAGEVSGSKHPGDRAA